MKKGPLHAVKVVEIAGLGPGPFCSMMLSDMGADVVRIDRPSGKADVFSIPTALDRGRRSIAADLKNPAAVEMVLRLIEQADVLVEGFRPGVMERLGLGPELCLQKNPRLVYGRMTGWGQDGPLANAPGHDINYISLSGVLHSIGEDGGPPIPPMNLVADFGGGGMFLAFGICAALVERQSSGKGQVIDAAMVDGSALLATAVHYFSSGWGPRGTNLLDGGAHFYHVYECSDGDYVSVGAIEPQFYARLLELLELQNEELPHQLDPSSWPSMRERLEKIFLSKTRDEWCSTQLAVEALVFPVLSLKESHTHPHNVQRETFVEIDGVIQPNAGPRFSRTPGEVPFGPVAAGAHTDEALIDWGFTPDEVQALRSAKAVS
ncbi:MAG: CaiB/BaiF CoA transferase family protein [Actinomycetota bacterium]